MFMTLVEFYGEPNLGCILSPTISPYTPLWVLLAGKHLDLYFIVAYMFFNIETVQIKDALRRLET